MENEKIPAKKFIINFGVLLGIVSVVLGVIMYVTNAYTDPHWIYSVVSGILLVGIITYGIMSFKKANQGFLSLIDALKVGIGIAVIGGIIGAVWTLLLTNVIQPDFMEQVMEVQKEKLGEKYPDFSQEQLDQSIAMMEKFSNPMITVAFSLIGNLFFGFIISLIGGLIMKNEQELY